MQTTHAAFKRAFRAAERALQTLEAVHAVRGAGPIDDASWKRLIFMQFHDCITGTSVPQVYEDGLIELQQIASDAISRARTLLGNADGEPALFNPLPIERSVVRDGRLLRLPALGGVRFKDAGIDIAPATVEQGVLENGIVRAVIDADGLIARLQVRGHDLNLRRPTGRVYLMPDHPSVFEAWEIERQTLAAGQEIVTAPGNRTERVENGVATVRFSRILPDGSPLTITYLLRPGSPVLEVEFEVNWQISQALLKYAIETQHRGQLARFGAPYGSSLRPQLSGTLAADAMFEAPASRWMCVSDDGEADGIMLLSEASY
ncbi:MAG TPA: glycoside hydrolase family 38 C-terminal domain-containing protein, partial [Tepidisphaeraceae bacterium]|nr:glycoside hydrolase family 38 C-terminal domain-containing protein [Tepidisphaeraceae bacterium]